ncbi:MAG: fatty acid CoA ligase FadD32 [Actinomycetota bacterium]|jgi:fatty acid CoA ligase FadD32|nr:fatty acid CoA ligase FadD32 [Actinomycetota bacterium]
MSLAERRYPEPTDGLVPSLGPLTSYLFDREESPEPAFTYLDFSADRDGAEHTVTWAELARKVRATAAELARVTSPGQRVAILAPQDLTYVVAFLGALHAGTIAVPLFAPEVSQHGERLVGALADSAAEIWLTSQGSLDALHELAEHNPVPMPKQIIAVDSLSEDVEHFEPVELDLDAPAYLQYTSGSTRAPAGAVITHRAVVTNSWQATDAFGVDETWTCAGWIPFFHDMGLIQMLCIPVLSGARSVFMTPFNFIMRPVRWLRQMSDYPNVFAAAPNFAFEYCARKVKEADRAGLDLSGVRTVINGSEPVRASTISAFQDAFGPHGFPLTSHRPSYGLAEATVFVTCTDEKGPVVTSFDRAALAGDRGVAVAPGTEGALELVAAGNTHTQLVRIVDPATGVTREDNEVGEIWAHGPNIADGYWEQPERSAETFVAEPGSSIPGYSRKWLRTGDLGLYHDGLLYITGRIKDLIIIDGKNHYPQDIEVTVQNAHPAIKQDRVAAFAVTTAQGVEGAAVVAEFDRKATAGEVDADEVAKAVKRAVSAAHDVKLKGFELVQPGGVLRTSSGKIARAATKARFWPAAGERP